MLQELPLIMLFLPTWYTAVKIFKGADFQNYI